MFLGLLALFAVLLRLHQTLTDRLDPCQLKIHRLWVVLVLLPLDCVNVGITLQGLHFDVHLQKPENRLHGLGFDLPLQVGDVQPLDVAFHLQVWLEVGGSIQPAQVLKVPDLLLGEVRVHLEGQLLNLKLLLLFDPLVPEALGFNGPFMLVLLSKVIIKLILSMKLRIISQIILVKNVQVQYSVSCLELIESRMVLVLDKFLLLLHLVHELVLECHEGHGPHLWVLALGFL